MKKRTILAVASLCGVATMSVLALSGLSGEAREFFADGDAGIWVHYARKEATKTEKGIREYWVNCSSHEYVFEQPTSGTIQEFTQYDTSGFTDDDDRWINTVTMTAKDVIMTEATKVLDLGAYAGGTITKMTAGTSKAGALLDLGTDASNLDVSGFDAAHKDDGVKTVEVDTIKDGKEYKIYAETTFVTAMINTVKDFQDYVMVDDEKTAKHAYVKLGTDNLNLRSIGTIFNWKFNFDNAFSGTFDGNGKTIVFSNNTNTGIFYNLKNATIKDLKINDIWYNGAKDTCLFARNIDGNVIFDNVSTKVTGGSAGKTVSTYDATGYIASTRAMGLTIKNCTFDASGYGIGSLVGRGQNYNSVTFINSIVKASSIVEAMHSNYLKKTFQPANVELAEGEEAMPGLTFEQA